MDMNAANPHTVVVVALRLIVSGLVQGVGFRPFVYRLAQRHGVTGRVQNQLGQVEIIAVGRPETLQQFQDELISNAPPLSRPTIDTVEPVDDATFDQFEIAASSGEADARVFVPHDYLIFTPGCAVIVRQSHREIGS